jgi:hypothetical protein
MTMKPKFSKRIHWDLAENDLAQALSRMRSAGTPVLDLTESTDASRFAYPSAGSGGASTTSSARVRSRPRGGNAARKISDYYRARRHVPVEDIFLAASTSGACRFSSSCFATREMDPRAPAELSPVRFLAVSTR